jgi:hypothetical protein
LPGPQAIKLLETSSSSQYTKKGSLNSESIPEVENRPFYKALVYLNLGIAGEQAQCPEQVGDCLVIKPYHQSRSEK